MVIKHVTIIYNGFLKYWSHYLLSLLFISLSTVQSVTSWKRPVRTTLFKNRKLNSQNNNFYNIMKII